MTDRKMTVIRLVVFCVLSFVPFWIILPMMNAAWGEPVYMSEAAAPAVYALGVFGMLIPSIAHLLTRLVTGEGFFDTYLGVHLKGNGKWYLASIWVKLAESVVSALLIWRLCSGELSFREAFPLEEPKALLGMLLLQLAFTIIVFFPAFGEEWGWRGYLLPKMKNLLPTVPMLLLTGTIWGLWHAPLTIIGHNYGLGYWGFPFTGIAMMCLFCIVGGTLFSYITLKAKSCWPAVFAHGALNGTASIGVLFLADPMAYDRFIGPVPTGIVGAAAYIVVAVWIVCKMRKEGRVCHSLHIVFGICHQLIA